MNYNEQKKVKIVPHKVCVKRLETADLVVIPDWWTTENFVEDSSAKSETVIKRTNFVKKFKHEEYKEEVKNFNTITILAVDKPDVSLELAIKLLNKHFNGRIILACNMEETVIKATEKTFKGWEVKYKGEAQKKPIDYTNYKKLEILFLKMADEGFSPQDMYLMPESDEVTTATKNLIQANLLELKGFNLQISRIGKLVAEFPVWVDYRRALELIYDPEKEDEYLKVLEENLGKKMNRTQLNRLIRRVQRAIPS